MIRLSKPEAPIASAMSTVMMLFIPDTVTFTQWPVMFTVLRMPLTVTEPSLQATVLLFSMPETLTSPPTRPNHLES